MGSRRCGVSSPRLPVSATLRSMTGAAFLGRKKRFRALIIWNRERGQLPKASHYQVTAEGWVFPWTGFSVQAASIQIQSARGREVINFTGLCCCQIGSTNFSLGSVFGSSNQIADLSFFAGNGKLANRGSPPSQPLLEGR